MRGIFALLGGLLSVCFFAPAGWADVIYDVDFENPPHIVDQQVVVGSGSDRPQFADATVIVRDGPADFTTQAASLEPAGAVTFAPGGTFSSGIALVSWDMAMISLGSTGPETAAVSIGSDSGLSIIMFFMGDLSIEISLGGVDPADVGSFALGSQDSFAFQIDLDNSQYDFSLNGTPVLNDQPLGSGWNMLNVSFGRDNLADPTYAVDNFQWEIIPEPSTLCLMLVSGVALMACRRRSMG